MYTIRKNIYGHIRSVSDACNCLGFVFFFCHTRTERKNFIIIYTLFPLPAKKKYNILCTSVALELGFGICNFRGRECVIATVLFSNVKLYK